MRYAARMKEWITDHDIRQKVLAKEFHITEAVMSHYMTGHSEVTVDVLVKFAKRSGLSMDYLVGLTDEPTPPVRISLHEQELLEGIRTLSGQQRELLVHIVHFMNRQNQKEKHDPSGAAPSV